MRREKYRVLCLAIVGLTGLTIAVSYGQDKAKKAAPRAPGKAAPRVAPQAGPKGSPPAVQSSPPAAEVEKLVRQAADAFAAAYNARDAKTIAAEFTPDAEFIEESGYVIRGREQIEKHFEALFGQLPEVKIKVAVDSVRVIAPNIAVEEGMVESTPAPLAPPDLSRYVALHVLQEGRWLIAHARDFPAEGAMPTSHERLEPLAWLVGDWVDEGPDVLVHTTCKWAENGNYLLQDFQARVGRQIATSGSTRIGWDPLTRQIKSWTFESDGSFSEALWNGAGEGWTRKSHGVTADGRTTSATITVRRIDDSTIAWESRDRVVGDEAVEDVGPITVKRRAPPPGH